MTRQRIETAFADLRDGDHLIDKSGKAWPVDGVVQVPDLAKASENKTAFWLCRDSGIRLHKMIKAMSDPCSVLRVPTHADELASHVAEVATVADVPEPTSGDALIDQEAEGEAVVAEVLGAVTVAEVTAAEVDEANAATEAKPITLPPFDQLTDLEMRSHLYLLHGLYGDDIQPRTHLVAMHAKAHAEQEAGRLQSKFRPHVHTAAVTE